MNWINFDIRKAAIWIIAGLLPLLSMNSQRHAFDEKWYDRPFSFLAGSVQEGFFSFSDGVRGTTSLYLNLIQIKKDSQDLREENDHLKAQLLQMDELSKENLRLSSLLDFQAHTKMTLIPARLISRDLLSDHSTIRINKGTHHGLKGGQAVISTAGVVGHIFKPGPFNSQVLLVTDRYSVVDGVVSRSRARGIVEGKGPDSLALRYVEKSEDIQKGDVLVTSGLDNIFPKGFPIATVDEVESKKYAASLRVELKPVVDPNKLDEVFIITDAMNSDLSGSFKTESSTK